MIHDLWSCVVTALAKYGEVTRGTVEVGDELKGGDVKPEYTTDQEDPSLPTFVRREIIKR